MGICPCHQNFPVKYPCTETIQQNIPILNSIFRKSSYVKSNLYNNNNNNNNNTQKLEFFSHYSIFIKSSFSLKLDFLKIEFKKKKGILLNSFRTLAFCYIFWTKWANAHFDPGQCLVKIDSHYHFLCIILKFCCEIKDLVGYKSIFYLESKGFILFIYTIY